MLVQSQVLTKIVIDIIMHSRKSLLFSNNHIWVKKDNPYFDVTMGSFNGAEVCELVGLYLLNIVKGDLGGKDGVSFFENRSGPELEKIKKKVCKISKITI